MKEEVIKEMVIFVDKIVYLVIIILMFFSNSIDLALSNNKLIINDDLIVDGNYIYTESGKNYIDVDYIISKGLNIKKKELDVFDLKVIFNDKGYVFYSQYRIMVNKLVEHENIKIINNKLYIAVKELNNMDSNFFVMWNDRYNLVRIICNKNVLDERNLIQKYYKEFGVINIEGIIEPVNPSKIAYLTFDDGPSANITPQVLDTLKQYNVKATFFINGCYVKGKEDVLKRIVEEGHTLGNHTYSHKSNMYKSLNSFKEEVLSNNKLIFDITGYTSKVFRAPYGNILSSTYKQFLKENGFTTYYWNIDPKDSVVKGIKAGQIIKNVQTQIQNKQDVIIILHDMSTKQESANSIKGIIKVLWENGYGIRALNPDIAINGNVRVY